MGQLVKSVLATLQPDESLERAADLLADSAVGLLPVVSSNGSLLGIVTRRDVLNAFRSMTIR
jgi:CBS domain-containing protein